MRRVKNLKMSTAIKINKFINNFFKSSLKESDKDLQSVKVNL